MAPTVDAKDTISVPHNNPNTAPPASVAPAAGNAAAPTAATKAVTYTALFDVDNKDAELLPQMTAQVVFVTGSAEQALTVPLTALQSEKDQQSQSVRVLTAKRQPEQRNVKLGVRSRHQVQVLDGVAEGERVIVGETLIPGGLRWLQW